MNRRRQPAASTLLVDRRDQSGALPEFYGVARVGDELDAFFGSFIVVANHIDALRDLPIVPDQVGALFRHGPTLAPETGQYPA